MGCAQHGLAVTDMGVKHPRPPEQPHAGSHRAQAPTPSQQPHHCQGSSMEMVWMCPRPKPRCSM